MRTLKEIQSYLQGVKSDTLIKSVRGNKYDCKTLDKKIIDKIRTYKKTNIQIHNVNGKDIYCIYDGNMNSYAILKEEM